MKIVCLDPFPLFPEHLTILKRLGDFILYSTEPKSESEAIDRVKDADIVIIFNTMIFPVGVLKSLTKTKMICVGAVGYDRIDIHEADSKGIMITHCPGHNAEAVAEHAIGLLLSVIRFSYQSAGETERGKFEMLKYKGKELRNRTLGIIGYGTIGQRVAEIAQKGFGMNIISTTSKSTRSNLEKLLRESDIISINTPLNERTRHLIGKQEFELMKQGVVIINTGRGAVIDEAELITALNSGKVGGAGLDVLTIEPFEDNNPLVRHPKTIVTPHIGWNTEESEFRLSEQVSQIVKAFVEGNPIHIIAEQRKIS